MIKKIRLRLGAMICLVFLVTSVLAAPSPLPLMQGIAQDMITALKKNKSRLAGNTALVRRIVNRVLIPHVNIYSMAGRVVGRSYWLNATAAQRTTFTRMLAGDVLATYASALASYDRDRVLFYPLRQNVGNYVQVRSVIVRRSGQKIPVSYSLRYRKGAWKIVDISVENVSIVNNYRAQYASTLGQGGLKYLIAKLRRN